MHVNYESKSGGDGFLGQNKLALSPRKIGKFERMLVTLADLKILLFSLLLKGEMAR